MSTMSVNELASPGGADYRERAGIGWLSSGIWFAGATLLVLIAAAAILRLAAQLDDAWREFPRVIGPRALVASLGALGAGIGGLVLMIRWGSRPGVRAIPVLSVGLGLAGGLRLVAIVLIHPPLTSDWLNYHRIAVSIASGGSWFDTVPTGYPMLLAPLYAIFGPDPRLAELVNLGLALWTAAMLFTLVRSLWGTAAAAGALYLFAIFPSQILMTTIVGTEVAYGAALMTVLAVAVVGLRRGRWWAVATGLLLGTSQYLRATSLLLVPSLMVYPWFAWRGMDALRRSLLVLAAFVLVLLPVAAHNIEIGAGPSLSTSRYAGWQILLGLTRNGQYSRAALDEVGLAPGTVEFDHRAGEMAVRHLLAQPKDVATLIVRKFARFWGADDHGVIWTVKSFDVSGAVPQAGLLASQVVYAGTLAFATRGALRRRHDKRHVVQLFFMIIGSVALIHTFAEIQTRYHSYLVPLFCALAAAGLTDMIARGVPIRLGHSSPER